MAHDFLDRIKWRLLIGEPGPTSTFWRQVETSARDDSEARDPCLRVASLRPERARLSAAYRATPEGERAYQAALRVAARGVWTFSLLYCAVFLILAIGLWLAA